MQQQLIDLATIWDRLPDLLGDAWHDLRDRLWSLLRAAEAPDPLQATKAVDEIVAILVRHKPAYAALLDAYLDSFSRQPTTGPVEAAGVTMPVRYTIINVLFGTDRKPTGSDKPERAFTGSRQERVISMSGKQRYPFLTITGLATRNAPMVETPVSFLSSQVCPCP